MNKEFLELLEKAKKIHESKNQDYTSGNVDENFMRMKLISEWFNDPLDKVFATMVAVKLARLATLLNKSTTPKHESVNDSFLDLFTYVGLWAANYIRRFTRFNENIADLSQMKSDIKSTIMIDTVFNVPTVNEVEIIGLNKIKQTDPKEQKLNELINMYDQLTDADYAKILSTARILVMRKS